MSKVLEALEKARREGALDRELWAPAAVSADSMAARAAAVEEEPPAPPPPAARERRPVEPVPPAALRQVDARVEPLHDPASVITEQYRVLRGALFGGEDGPPPRTLAVTSAVKGEGKSLTAVNLALAVAQEGTRRVLLVDADLRRPHVHELLGVPVYPGLGECLTGAAAFEAVVQPTPFHGLSVVPAGRAAGQPAEQLAGPEFEAFVQAAAARFDVVLFDTPPVYPLSDLTFLAAHVDGIVLVVRAGKTPKHMLKHALQGLPPEKVLGTVLNRAEDLGPGYRRYGYGSGYGYGYGYGERPEVKRRPWLRWRKADQRG